MTTITTTMTMTTAKTRHGIGLTADRLYMCVHVSSATRVRSAGQSHRGDKHASHTYDFFSGRRVKGTAGSYDRPIPMRKANPAFCDRSKSHKKLDPFDDRKMVYWLAENPFLVRSSAISVSVSVHPPSSVQARV